MDSISKRKNSIIEGIDARELNFLLRPYHEESSQPQVIHQLVTPLSKRERIDSKAIKTKKSFASRPMPGYNPSIMILVIVIAVVGLLGFAPTRTRLSLQVVPALFSIFWTVYFCALQVVSGAIMTTAFCKIMCMFYNKW